MLNATPGRQRTTMNMLQSPIDADRLWADLMALATITEPARPFTRRSFTTQFLEGRDWLAGRLREAGLAIRIDAAGNLIGRREGRGPGAPAILVGSHSDTVPGGGRFDGIAGVIAALEVSRALAEQDVVLDHALEVVDFLAEEPSEYGLSCVGSRGMAGALGTRELALIGPGGETLAAALGRMGGVPERVGDARRDDIFASLELHIEQGTVLERERVDIGIVSAIVGITRLEIRFTGEAAHAGTTAMGIRHDAAVATAEAVLAVRDIACDLDRRGQGYVVATTGIVEVLPGAANVVAGAARLVVDLRAETSELLSLFRSELDVRLKNIASRSAVRLDGCVVLSHNEPAECDRRLRQVIADSAAEFGYGARAMASGAGHDAAFVSRIAPSAMLFVPCRNGRSHCPEEWCEPGELAAGAAVMCEVVRRIDAGLPDL
jgi:beta-ureidopropionase / N-carbamoyl-L-amino-acid hydrolase